MARNPVVIVYTGEWDEVTLDALASAVDPTDVARAAPLSPGEPTQRTIVTDVGGRVIDGLDVVARLLRWCDMQGASPSEVRARVLLASSATAMRSAPATQGRLPGINADPLLNWGATRPQPPEPSQVTDPEHVAGLARHYKDTAYDLMGKLSHDTARHRRAWQSYNLLARAAETGELPTWAPSHLSTIEKVIDEVRALGSDETKPASRRPDGCPACGGDPDGQGGAGFKDGRKCMTCGGSGWKDLKAWQARRDEQERLAPEARPISTPASADRMLVCPRCGLEVADREPLARHRPGVGNLPTCPGTGEMPIEVSRPKTRVSPPELVVARGEVRRLKREVTRADASAARAAKSATTSPRAKGRATRAAAKRDAKRADLVKATERVRDAETTAARTLSGPRFSPGKMVATPAALEALVQAQQTPLEFVRRHLAGDWGDVSADDAAANDAALREGDRVLSAYKTRLGTKLWVITVADRSVTTVLLPSDY